MPLNDTLTTDAIGAGLSSVTAGTALALTQGDPRGIDRSVVIVATSVTTGANLQVEVDCGSGYEVLAKFSITADGSYAIPLAPKDRKGSDPESVRVRVNSRTDGTYTPHLTTLTRAGF